MIPLYDQTSWQGLLDSQTAHPGLLFDKYPNKWETTADGEVRLPTGSKKTFLDEIIKKYNKLDHFSALKNTLDRQNHLVEQVLYGHKIEAQTDWRFVSGIGSGHPYETGFIWHRTLAVPYLPGSSVKGMVRAYAVQWIEDDTIKEVVTTLFGPEENSPEKAAGSLIVFDALPVTVPKLEIDILNPHYKDYYENPDKTPPADYLNPVPVFFLTVAQNMTFRFSMAPRPGAHETPEQADQALKHGLRLLKDALSTIGAGGKTAVGYGVMVETLESNKRRLEKEEKEEKERHEKGRLEAIEKKASTLRLNGLAIEVYKQAQQNQWEMNYEKYCEDIKKWFPLIEQEQNLQIRNQCIDILAEILDKKYPGITEEPDRKKGKKKDKFYFSKPRSREIAKQLINLRNISR